MFTVTVNFPGYPQTERFERREDALRAARSYRSLIRYSVVLDSEPDPVPVFAIGAPINCDPLARTRPMPDDYCPSCDVFGFHFPGCNET